MNYQLESFIHRSSHFKPSDIKWKYTSNKDKRIDFFSIEAKSDFIRNSLQIFINKCPYQLHYILGRMLEPNLEKRIDIWELR